jgi:cytochrome o ubiquinol oxidase operon protein cyoD
LLWGREHRLDDRPRFAQIGVHLVFFLHIGFGPESTNNIVALAFGVWIVLLVIGGSIPIIANLNANMMPM